MLAHPLTWLWYRNLYCIFFKNPSSIASCQKGNKQLWWNSNNCNLHFLINCFICMLFSDFQPGGTLLPPETPLLCFYPLPAPSPTKPAPLSPASSSGGASCAWDTLPFMSRKGMFTENRGCFLGFCFCSKHLNMHHSLRSLNHVVGSETHAHLTRTPHTHLHQSL